MTKEEKLKKLEQEMESDTLLPLRKEANLVFGEGSPEARVVFIGEAPGFHEDKQKRPFVGRGGQLLEENIKKIGWKRDGVYITNIVKHRPPENRDPEPSEIEVYSPYLKKQIEILDPKAIVTLGRFAMNYFLPQAKITRDNGKAFLVDGRLIVPLFHPAAALRSTRVLQQFEESFKKLPKIVEGNFAEMPPPLKEKKEAQDPLF